MTKARKRIAMLTTLAYILFTLMIPVSAQGYLSTLEEYQPDSNGQFPIFLNADQAEKTVHLENGYTLVLSFKENQDGAKAQNKTITSSAEVKNTFGIHWGL